MKNASLLNGSLAAGWTIDQIECGALPGHSDGLILKYVEECVKDVGISDDTFLRSNQFLITLKWWSWLS